MKRLSMLALLVLAACGRSAPAPQRGRVSPPPAATTPAVLAAPAARGLYPAIVNGDFEQAASGDSIPGWTKTQHAGPASYDMRVDAEGAYAGHASFHMTRVRPQIYGSLVQNLDGAAFAGKTVELSAMLKSHGVGPGGWKLFVNGNVPGTLSYSPGLTGDSGWTRQSVRMTLPAGLRQLTIGVSLLDAGDGWMDDVELKTLN